MSSPPDQVLDLLGLRRHRVVALKDVLRENGNWLVKTAAGPPATPPGPAESAQARPRPPRRVEFTIESFLLALYLLEGTDLVTVVPERAVPQLRRTAAVRVLEPPVDLPPITEMLWWHPRRAADSAPAWIRDSIAAIAAGLA